jgi:hypothetical protein
MCTDPLAADEQIGVIDHLSTITLAGAKVKSHVDMWTINERDVDEMVRYDHLLVHGLIDSA